MMIILASVTVCAQDSASSGAKAAKTRKPTRIAIPDGKAGVVLSELKPQYFGTLTPNDIQQRFSSLIATHPFKARVVSHPLKDGPRTNSSVKANPETTESKNSSSSPEETADYQPQIAVPKSEPNVWWAKPASESITRRPQWVKFDIETVLLDTLEHSPRIQSLTHDASMALERIVQQDAAFDPTVMLGSMMGKSNDPVGNTLTTGGAPRLIEDSMNMRGGIRMNTRRGTELGLNQELGLLDSNSTFFSPNDQGNARLGLSLTQPLLSRGGEVYNERLIMQARIDSRSTWQEMRNDVEQRIAEVMTAYWRLYETRCHVLQQRGLLERGEVIHKLISARHELDSSRVEVAKAKQRVARRQDQLLVLEAELSKRQMRLATLIGSDKLFGAESKLEMIPQRLEIFPSQDWELRDATVQALENRPDVRAAGVRLESSALAVKVTRTELVPQLNAVVNASLAALNGDNDFGASFLDQFSGIVPGFTAGLQYEMPYGRRAAQARHREAFYQYRKRSEELREVMQQTQFDVRIALENVRLALAQQKSKARLLQTAVDEEQIQARRWELTGGDGSRVGLVLENLLDAQQRRTDAERELVTVQSDYMAALIELQRAMGTLLQLEGIEPLRSRGHSNVEFVKTDASELSKTITQQIVDPKPDQENKPIIATKQPLKDPPTPLK